MMDKTDYMRKAKDLFSDPATYKMVKKDPTRKVTTEVQSLLKKLKDQGTLREPEYRKLLPTRLVTPKFYGLPNIHKHNTPLQPIVDIHGSPTYGLARLVTDILQPLVGKTTHHLQNSTDLIQRMKNVVLEEDKVLVSYDVTILFTSVPVDEVISIVRRRLQEDTSLSERTNLNVDDIVDTLSCCLNTTYFTFQG